jgi:peroxiredoxin Q/BCP
LACDGRGGEQPAAGTVAQPVRLLAEGDALPDIAAMAHTGQAVALREYRGQPLVVYFYPKDDTPGCTLEAQGMRDAWGELRERGAMVFGVSADDRDSHLAFAQKHELPFLLLVDTKHELANAFGVPVRDGRAARITFVIDAAGKVRKVFEEVRPEGHATEVLAALGSLD